MKDMHTSLIRTKEMRQGHPITELSDLIITGLKNDLFVQPSHKKWENKKHFQTHKKNHLHYFFVVTL